MSRIARSGRRLVILTVLLGGAHFGEASTARAQAPAEFTDVRSYPLTPAGRRAEELVAALSAGDRERMRAYILEHFAPSLRDSAPINEHLAAYDRQYGDSHGYDFYATRAYTPPRPETACVVILRNRLTEGWDALIVEVDPEPPNRVTKMQLTSARRPPDLAPDTPSLTAAQVADELGAFLDRLADADVFSGAVLVAKDGQVLFSKAVGEACKEYGIANQLDTRFNVASINKMFTAVAVAQLVEQGKVKWDDRISTWVDESWLPREVTEQIQVRHLLDHTSGLGSYLGETFQNSSRARFRNLADFKPLIQSERPRFTPGTRWAYSNTGMLLAGVVIEGASGMDYFDYVMEHIYKPAGMTSTDSYEMDRFPANLALGYKRHVGRGGEWVWVNNLFTFHLRGTPAGGGYSTVEDLLRFDQAMRAGTLVSAETAEILWSAKSAEGSPGYGYGFEVRPPPPYPPSGPPGRVTGHGGAYVGVSTTLDMYLDSGWTFIVLSNYNQARFPVSEKIRNLVGRISE